MTITVRLLAALFALAILAPAAMADPTYTETDDRFYLRGTGCGAETDLFLSDRSGEDDYDGCGTIGGLPVNEVLAAEGSGGETLTTRGTAPIIVDANRDLVVVIRTESWFGDGIPGAGQSVVDVAITGTPAAGGFVPVALGSGSSDEIVVGADNATHTITLDIPDTAHLAELSNLSLEISWHGANINVNNLGMSGDSHFTVPTLEVVQD
ncbi:hypothetical protein [Euzebya rosea]|uniref:hypothetical protein n=1 Tax=Euzebya rosea TaxID=2052804 RepID=UPI000D3E50E0|nr:hypothetical protein [Euzebya rosea]